MIVCSLGYGSMLSENVDATHSTVHKESLHFVLSPVCISHFSELRCRIGLHLFVLGTKKPWLKKATDA